MSLVRALLIEPVPSRTEDGWSVKCDSSPCPSDSLTIPRATIAAAERSAKVRGWTRWVDANGARVDVCLACQVAAERDESQAADDAALPYFDDGGLS